MDCELQPVGLGSLWLLWQLADSAFPVGSFGHSNGLESAWQHGEVRSSSELSAFVEVQLTQLRYGALPFFVVAHTDQLALPEVDRECDAFLTNHVANRASRAQGRAFLACAERAFEHKGISLLRRETIQHDLPAHLPPVMGAVTRLLCVTLPNATQLFVFTQVRGVLSAAVRLGIVGPLEAQAMQARLAPAMESAAAQPESLSIADAAQTAPFLDVLQGAQDRLYSRLFQS